MIMDRVVKNQNANETDIDKQFKDDLERATALSLETLALEEFRRNRSLHSVGGAAAAVATTSELSSVISASSMKFSSCMFQIKCQIIARNYKNFILKFIFFFFLLQHKIIYHRTV